MPSYKVVQVGETFQVVIPPSLAGAGGFLMGFGSEAEAVRRRTSMSA